MLQQTQVSRVISKYEAWLEKFPTVESLAKASTREVLRAWSGLGYNRRALYLKRTAEVIVSEYSENSVNRKIRKSDSSESQKHRQSESSEFSEEIVWPRTIEELKKLPGIGEYTARAVACFAFDQQVAVVDTNVRKVILIHFLKATKETKETQETKVIQQIAGRLLPYGKAYEWNQALMDYAGAVLKTAKVPLSGTPQSKFHGSDRYFRGEILRILLKEHRIAVLELAKRFAAQIREEKTRSIVAGLEKDLLIETDGVLVSIKQ